MRFYSTILTCFVFLLVSKVSAQAKIEVEKGVRASEVPEKATDWVNSVFPEARKQWFLENTSGKTSYEAKFKVAGTRYSVEFDSDGGVEDVEFITDWNDLTSVLREKLDTYFESDYDRHRIRKIQQQLIGGDEALSNYLTNKEQVGVVFRYEIEYFAKNQKGRVLWEGLFDAEGSLISKRQVILRPTDNLNY